MRSRLFVGVFLPDAWGQSFVLMGDAIRRIEPAWRDATWVPQENLHVTLAFLGDVEEHAVPALCDRLTTVAAGHSAHSLTLKSLRARPSLRRARMIWAALADPQGRCAALSADVAAAVGSPADHRSFHAHVTLCRSRRPKPIGEQTLEAARDAARATPPSLSVPSITLCESRLTPRGAVYSARATWPLRSR